MALFEVDGDQIVSKVFLSLMRPKLGLILFRNPVRFCPRLRIALTLYLKVFRVQVKTEQGLSLFLIGVRLEQSLHLFLKTNGMIR